MSFEDFIIWMREHEDTWCLLDIKLCDYEEAKYIAESIIKIVDDEAFLSRLVISARTSDMMRGYSDVYDFPYKHLLYASDSVRDESIYEAEDFLKFCSQYNVSSFSIAVADYTKELADKLQSTGLKTYVYMVENSYDVQYYMDVDADFMISNTLTPDCITKLEQCGNMGAKVTRENEGLLIEWTNVAEACAYYIQREEADAIGFEDLEVLENRETQYSDTSAKYGIYSLIK